MAVISVVPYSYYRTPLPGHMTRRTSKLRLSLYLALALGLFLISDQRIQAAILPDDRSDALYRVYDGGGVEVTGPAILVRKGIKNRASLYSSFNVDNISSASIDVVTTASPYDDTRNELSVGTDYLYKSALFNISGTYSDENDYTAHTMDMNISNEVFGNMTTIGLGFTRGWDDVGRVDTNFSEDLDRYRYRLTLSQVASPRLIINFNYEAIVEDGYLGNPYRSARLLGASVPERYPRTRTSNAVAVRAIQSVTKNASARADYRYFWDTWNISAHTLEVSYNQYITRRFLTDIHYRYYTQSAADFYSDNFTQELNYMSRDKTLSDFSRHAVGFKLTYVLFKERKSVFNSGTVNLTYDYINTDYNNFTDVRDGKLYSFDANLFQLMFSVWY